MLRTTVTGTFAFEMPSGVSIHAPRGQRPVITITAATEDEATQAAYDLLTVIAEAFEIPAIADALAFVRTVQRMAIQNALTGNEWAEVITDMIEKAGFTL